MLSCAHPAKKNTAPPPAPVSLPLTIALPSPPAHALPRGPAAPVVLKILPATLPPWHVEVLKGPHHGADSPRLSPSQTVALGTTRSVHQTPYGLIVMDTVLGVMGLISPPEGARWVGFGAEDALMWAGPQGIWRAQSQAQWSGPAMVFRSDEKKPIQSWDVQEHTMIATYADRVSVSHDGAETWHAVPFGEAGLPALTQASALVRPDGVMVVHGMQGAQPKTFVSRTGGRSWEAATFEPKQLQRHGSWIWNGEMTCPAILSEDGIRWSSDPDLRNLPGYKDPRSSMLRLATTHTPVPPTPLATSRFPPAPKASPDMLHTGLLPTCLDPIPTDPLEAPPDAPHRDALALPCAALLCLTRQPHKPTQAPGRHITFILQDGTLTRQAHLAHYDRAEDTLAIFAPPPGCFPRAVFTLWDLQILHCDAALWTRQGQGRWLLETPVTEDVRFAGIQGAPDGTLVLHGVCREQGTRPVCGPSFFRAPGDSGAQHIWRSIPHALDVVPLTGGRALALQGTHDAGRGVLWVAGIKGERLEGVGQVVVESPVHRIRVDDKGGVQVATGDPSRLFWHSLLGDGTLKPL